MNPSLPDPPGDHPEPSEMPEQGVIINGEFRPAQMLSAELVAERAQEHLARLAAATDDAERRRCIAALIHTVEIYGTPAVGVIETAGRTLEQLRTDLEALPPAND